MSDGTPHQDHARFTEEHLRWRREHMEALSILRRAEAAILAHEARILGHDAEIMRHEATLATGGEGDRGEHDVKAAAHDRAGHDHDGLLAAIRALAPHLG